MGLDMTLEASKYMHIEDYATMRQTEVAEKIKKMFPEMNGKRLDRVVFIVAEWRKDNQIHKWFVDNVQDGVDDCKYYYVSREKIQQLIRLCVKVLENKELAQSLLPAQGGFFFGSTEYDDDYFISLKRTVEKLSECEKIPEEYSFYYSSSW